MKELSCKSDNGIGVAHLIVEGEKKPIVHRDPSKIVSNDVPGQPFRIYSFMRHTMLGEMGFMRHETRSADLVARGETVVYALDRPTFDAMTGKDDATISALLELISVTLSDRMVSANRTIAELQA